MAIIPYFSIISKSIFKGYWEQYAVLNIGDYNKLTGKTVAKKQKKAKKNKELNSSSNKYTVYILGAVIVVFSLILFSKSFDYQLVKLDDDQLVEKFYDFNTKLSNIPQSFVKTIGTTFYRPILNISFIIDANIGGKDLAVYHTSNVLYHAIACLMIFLTMVKLKFDNSLAFVLAMVAAAHPLLVPAVSWIPGRNDTLITIFSLLSFIYLISFLESSPEKKSKNYVLHLLFYAIALFTKEIAAFLPFLFYLFAVAVKKRDYFDKELIRLAIGWFVIGLFWFYLRSISIEENAPEALRGIDALLYNYPALFALLGKILIPVKLIVISDFDSISIITGIIFIALLSAGVYFTKQSDKRLILFAGVWFVLLLIPTFLLKWVHTEGFFDYAEHRSYLPLLGILIIVGELLRKQNINFTKAPAITAFAALLIFYVVKTVNYQDVFENRETFWGHSLEVYPERARSYEELGVYYYNIGDQNKARQFLFKGKGLDPDNHRFYSHLSNVYTKLNMYDSTYYYSMKTLELDSNNYVATLNLAKYYAVGKKDHVSAIPYLETLIESKKDIPRVHELYLNLGVGYQEAGENDKAIEAFKEVVKRRNMNIPALVRLGNIYFKQENYSDSERMWLQAIRYNPKLYDVYNDLVVLYLKTGRYDEAKAMSERLTKSGGELRNNVKRMLDSVV